MDITGELILTWAVIWVLLFFWNPMSLVFMLWATIPLIFQIVFHVFFNKS